MTTMFVCVTGCCAGCYRCYGMSLGCHRMPCTCDKPCVCKRNEEGDLVIATSGCERHANGADQRPAMGSPWWTTGMRCPVCDPNEEFIRDADCKTCGGLGAFSKAPADYVTRCLETKQGKGPLWERVCERNARYYIWPKEGDRRWRPVCGQHVKGYIRAHNIIEMDG
jgi:hypothetical protein